VYFSNHFYQLIGERELTNVSDFNLISELANTPECPEYFTVTSSDVIVQLYGCPLTMSDSDFNTIATLFVDTYNIKNGINAKMCDRFFRRITSAEVILPEDDFVSLAGRNLKTKKVLKGQRVLADDSGEFQCPDYFDIRLDITAECRGCNISKISLFDQEMDVNFFESFNDDYFSNYGNSNSTDVSFDNEILSDDDFSDFENETVSDDIL
jgi:hypothetical protein